MNIASMGPGLFSPDDDYIAIDLQHLRQVASMGPGLFSPDDHSSTIMVRNAM